MSKRISWLTDVLRTCYDEQAVHFDQTRKKQRPELPWIADHVSKSLHIRNKRQTTDTPKDHFTVLDVGCGTGRLYESLEIVAPSPLAYTGIDFAPGMIGVAKKKYPAATRKVADMLAYMHDLSQESVDLIVGVASVQHLFPLHERELFFAHAYRILRRWWSCLLTNRSYSRWFLRRYRLPQLHALGDSLLLPQRKRNDLLISRKDPQYATNHKQYERYYHLFTLTELQQLSLVAGFVIDELAYMQQDGSIGTDRKKARNTVLALRKDVR